MTGAWATYGLAYTLHNLVSTLHIGKSPGYDMLHDNTKSGITSVLLHAFKLNYMNEDRLVHVKFFFFFAVILIEL